MKPIQSHSKSDYNLDIHYNPIKTSTQYIESNSVPKPKQKHKKYAPAKSSHIQPLRTTIISQHSNNPFQRHSSTNLITNVQHHPRASEFFNYKIMDDAKSVEDMEAIIEEEPKIKESPTLKAPSMGLNDTTIRDFENEIRLELLIGSLLNNDIEKDMKKIEKMQPIKLDEVDAKKVLLPATHFKNTIVLDIDETLMHTIQGSYIQVYGTSPIKDLEMFIKNTETKHIIQIIKRPYLDWFLKVLSENFELIVNK